MSHSLRHRFALVATVLALAACGDDGTKPQPLTLTLSSSSVTLEELETVQISADVGGPGGATVTWASSDDDVATVDAQGQITGVAAGSATVTATARADGQSAQGNAGVTVTPLPLAIAIDGFVKDGQPVSPDQLGLGVSAVVVYDVPANFEGFIEILAGGEVLSRVEMPDAGLGSALPTSEIVVTANSPRRAARAEAPLAVTAFRDGTIQPQVTNDVATALSARIGSGSGGSAESPTTTASFNVGRMFGITSIDASRSATGPLGHTWIGGSSPLVVLNGQIVDFSAIPTDLSGDLSITVLNEGAATTLYGAAGVNGVVQITIRDELDDQEGEVSFGDQATWSGSAELIPVLNADDLGVVDLGLAQGFFWDGKAPALPDLDLPDNIWLQPGPAWPQLSEHFGLRAEPDAFGPATIMDLGVGGFSADLLAGTTPDLEFGPIEEMPDEFLALAFGWILGIDVRDDLDNVKRWVLATRMGIPVRTGVDPTPPNAPVFVTGLGFTVSGTVNPTSLFFAWNATDPDPGSGIESYHLSLEYSSPALNDCLLGFGTQCAPVAAPEGAQNGWSPDNVPPGISAEFRLSAGASDFAKNLGPLAYADWVLDAAPIQGSGTPIVGPLSNGTMPVSGFDFLDELEVNGVAALAQYSMAGQGPLPPMYLGSQQVGELFDGTFNTTANQPVDIEGIVSIETTEAGPQNPPTGTIYPFGVLIVAGFDHAGHSATVSNTSPNVAPRSTSFGDGGLSHFGFGQSSGLGTICNPVPSNGENCNGAPTTVDVTVEAFTSGVGLGIQEVFLVGTQVEGGNPIPIAPWTTLDVTDLGSSRKGMATFTLDGADLNLTGGGLNVWAIGRDGAGGGILSQKVSYTTVF